jgi:hypothetical protein
MIFTIPVHFFVGGISYLIYVSSAYAFKAQVAFIIWHLMIHLTIPTYVQP